MNEFVLADETTPANLHDNKSSEHLVAVSNPDKGPPFLLSGAIAGRNTKSSFRVRPINGIQKHVERGKELNTYFKRKDEAISKVRYIVKRNFGGQKRWFGLGPNQYRGLFKTHTQRVMDAIAPELAIKLPNPKILMG